MRIGKLGLNYNILIFLYTNNMYNFSFPIYYPRFPIKLGTGIAFYISDHTNIQLINYIQNIIEFVNVITIGRRNKYIFLLGKNRFISKFAFLFRFFPM